MTRNFEIELSSNTEDISNINHDTDSASFQSLESENSLSQQQISTKKTKKKPKNQSNNNQFVMQGTSANAFLSESSTLNNDDNPIESNDASVTDSTTILDSAQYQLSTGDVIQPESPSDSTTIELSCKESDTGSTISSQSIQETKNTKTKIVKASSTSSKSQSKNEQKDETPITRLERMLRSKINQNNPDYLSKYINSPMQSGSNRNTPRGIYDPLNIRPKSTKQALGFKSIPIDSDDCRRRKNNSQYSSRNSTPRMVNSNNRKQIKYTSSTQQSSPTQPSIQDLSGPISGFTVTDGNPSPREISLNLEDPIAIATIQLINKGEIPPENLRYEVASLLKRKSVEFITNEQYDEAEIIESAGRYLRNYLQDKESIEKNKTMKRGIENRLKKIEAEYKLESDDWDAVLQSFKEKQQIERKKLIKRHQQEQKQFKEKWSDPAILIQFNKPSPQLLLLRKQQKTLALTKNFAEAKKLKKDADNLQKIETEEAEQRAIAVMHARFQNLLEKQKKELECFDEHNNRSCDYVLAEKQKLIEPMQKTIRSLKSGYPNYYEKSDESDASSFSVRSSVKQEKIPQVTPRTKKRLNDYKIQENSPKLNLNSLRLRESVANKRASSSYRVLHVPK